MRTPVYALIVLLFISNSNLAIAEEVEIPRAIVALYDGNTSDITTTNIHNLVEMPLNHLGLTVEYYDIHKPLPDVAKRKDVRGVITWLFYDTKIEKPEEYLKWALNVVDAGKKYVVIGTLGVNGGENPHPSLTIINSFMGKLGMKMTNGWTETAFDVSYKYNTPSLFLEKDAFKWIHPSYETALSIDSQNIVHLSAEKGNSSEENSDLIVTGKNGGYMSSGYITRTDVIEGKNARQWIVNPFEFFRLALETDDLPKPDTTTIAGRRIYYSHIDGDGFNSVTRLEDYRNQQILSAQVVMERAVKPYPEMPVTLTVIAADIDPDWAAIGNSRAVAREFFALPQVEAGSHTYSHPFSWDFFKDGNPNKEVPYLRAYPQKGTQAVWTPSKDKSSSNVIKNLFNKHPKAEAMPDGNATPRAFARLPFDIKKEVHGSIEEINSLLPKGKKVELITWSGDCSPWEEALYEARMAGVQNINGGDTMFDSQHPSYTNIAGVGRQVGKERQIYASTSNEIPYTKEWTENFDAYRHLKETLVNTESPIRLKPLNIYYHLYSGEREAGLNALLANLEFAKTQNIAPITTSHYTHIAEGFYKTKLTPLAKDSWQIEDRGALQTIRFDRHAFKSVDFERSKGVVGQRSFQGSLYVYLDATDKKPIIALKNNENYFAHPLENVPYLIESRWLISNLRYGKSSIDFTAQGYGSGDILWQVPAEGKYIIKTDGGEGKVVESKNRQLKLKLENNAVKPLHFTITRV